MAIDGVESGPKVACTKKLRKAMECPEGDGSPDLKQLVQKKLWKGMECLEGDGS
jgi:hypothetical protein